MPNTPTAHTEYPRPEYVGRDDELINHAEAARRAGVTTGALANWKRRHDDFPKVAKLLHSGPGHAQKFIPAEEFDAFLARQQEGRPRRATGRRRHPAEVASEELRHRVARVEALEARETALVALCAEAGRASDTAKLTRTRAALAAARAREAKAAERLTAAIF